MNPENPQPPIAPQPPTLTPQPVVVANAPQVTGSKAMAIVALVLSILGFLTGFIFIGFVLAIVGIILGIVGLVKHKPGKGLNIASVIISGLCLLSFPITLTLTITAYNGITNKAHQAVQQSELEENN